MKSQKWRFLFGALLLTASSVGFAKSDDNSGNVEDQATEKPAFNFMCNHQPCPTGSYQSICPWCSGEPQIGKSSGYLQCLCFSPEAQLQNLVIFHSLYSECNPNNGRTLSYDYNSDGGALVCDANSASREKLALDQVEPEESKAQVESQSGPVDFQFVCSVYQNYGPLQLANNCPTKGNYKEYCPRCSVTNGGSTLVCNCFDDQATMNQSEQFLNISHCTSVNVNSEGRLSCH